MSVEEMNSIAVTVVIPTYNDSGNLPSAVCSVLNQTLNSLEVVIVDDCSTDKTPAVADRLVKRDSRVSYIRLSENTGGVGGPRNAGMDVAKGEYIFFLDSDDVLNRHALKNLYLAARRDGCDFIIGQTVRKNITSGKEKKWLPHLFEQEVINTSLEDNPELLEDTLTTNKLYSIKFIKKHNLYFETDVHYEDIIFSAEALSKATKISIIPDVVYIWKIYPITARKTITQQRDDLKSLVDRLYAIEKRNKTYGLLNNKEIDRLCNIYFLGHHAALYLMDSCERTDEYLERMIELLHPIVNRIDSECFESLSIQNRALYSMLLLKNKDGLREISYARKYNNRLAGKIIKQKERVYWMSSSQREAVEDPEIKTLQDITESYLYDTPTPSLNYLHRVHKIIPSTGKVKLIGDTVDPLRRFDFERHVDSKLVIVHRDNEKLSFSVPVEFTIGQNGEILWEVTVDKFNFPHRQGSWSWDVYLAIEQGSRINKSLIYLKPNIPEDVYIYNSSKIKRLLGVGLHLYRTVGGNLSFKYTEANSRRIPLAAYRRATRLSRRSISAIRRISRYVSLPIFKVLPINSRKIFFESSLGKVATGSPYAVYEHILKDERFEDFTFVWSTGRHRPDMRSDRIKIVRRKSWRYYYALSTSKVIIDDQGFPAPHKKRRGQLYVQTWHGIPLKHMGIDEPKVKADAKLMKDILNRTSQWDALVAPSDYFEDTFVQAFRYEGKLIRGGTPRNDELINPRKTREDILRELDIPGNRKIVLYTPTFREASRAKGAKLSLEIDIEQWIDELGEDTYLLIRTHYLNKVKIPSALSAFCMNVSNYHEVNDLYLIADCMITDYSSTMFDYALLNRPIVFYTYDYSAYINSERGTYFDLKAEAPGPVVDTQDDLHEVIKGALRKTPANKKQKRFIDRYCSGEDGLSSERVVDYIAGELRG